MGPVVVVDVAVVEALHRPLLLPRPSPLETRLLNGHAGESLSPDIDTFHICVGLIEYGKGALVLCSHHLYHYFYRRTERKTWDMGVASYPIGPS